MVAKPGALPLEIAGEPGDPDEPAPVGPAQGQSRPVAAGGVPGAGNEGRPMKRIALRRRPAAGRRRRRRRLPETRPSPLPPPPTEVELQALLERRDALQKRLTELIVANGEKSVAKAPRGGVMIGIPTSFTRSILEQVVTGLFSEMTLTLKNLKVHKEGEVKVKMLVAKRTVGKYVLDVQIHQVQGILRPGKPDVVFSRNRVDRGPARDARRGQGQRRHPPAVGQQGPRRQHGVRRRRRHQGGDGRRHPPGLSAGRSLQDHERRETRSPSPPTSPRRSRCGSSWIPRSRPGRRSRRW